MSYRYRLFKNGRENDVRRYTLDELRDMGTFMLRDICVSEKIMTRSAGVDPKRLDREALIELLFRYRGREEESLADGFWEESIGIVKNLSAMAVMAAEKLEVPGKIEIKKDIPMLEAEDVLIKHGFDGEYFVGTISDRAGEILAVFEVRGVRMSLSPRRMAGSFTVGVYQDLQILLFDAASSLKVLQAYNSQKCSVAGDRRLTAAMARLPVLSIAEVRDSQEPLVIDFGAGYTAAASSLSQNGCSDKILEVRFQGGSCLCPSAAAVKRCRDGKAEFCFGYEALRLIRRSGYGERMTFFHNLKLFLYEERILDVCDLEGNAACISSDTLLSQFFQYIIGAAKGEHGRNYTRLSFLMPDKRGGLALKRLQDLLPDYQVANVCSEAINCVYGEIIRRGDYEGEDLVRELAFHCGAGSSSLVCCDHEAENTRVAYKVQMKARYLNGDSGFGGNRLTCLIFMYLKIRVMLAVTGSEEEIFDEKLQDSYSYVDQYGGTREVYEGFYGLYEQAEQIIPTRFGTPEATEPWRRQNFYRLWFLAEGLKTAFFSGEPVNRISLPDRFSELCVVNVAAPDGIREYRMEFSVHKEALELVMAPEIYRIVKRFIEPLCDEYGILMGCRIKFTGMSCQIPVFRDALREFTVGRRVRTKRGADMGLKLRALEGAILRGQMEKSGRIIPEITEEEADIPYIVTVEAHDGSVMRIISGQQPDRDVFGYVKRHAATREVEFTVLDVLEYEIGRRVVDLDMDSFEHMSYDGLFDAYPMFQAFQGDFDSIGEDEIRLFVYREDNWDFCVLPAARRQGALSTGRVSRFLFDDNSVDYFCGLF
ncbi:hypothetical protein D7X87_03120 [bacterium D16-54]|nr:hypothetical protein D7X87_03120 [bacterium D16-54]RKJ16615.1 hypothetical protein D7X65_03115 [bacterium D16-56]